MPGFARGDVVDSRTGCPRPEAFPRPSLWYNSRMEKFTVQALASVMEAGGKE